MKIKKNQRTWTPNNIDDQLVMLVENDAVSPVAWWLMACYLYYQRDVSILKDETFDWLGNWIKDNWETIKHPTKRLIRKSATFTGYYIKSYPTRVKVAAIQLANKLGIEVK